MDIHEFRSILESYRVDVWTVMETAIMVASIDFGSELKQQRDKIVERLYAASSCSKCIKSSGIDNGNVKEDVALIEKDKYEEDGEDGNGDFDIFGGLFDDEQKRILDIRQQIEDPDQSEDSLVDLLESLADMELSFESLKETDIGRHVNKLRKHPSNDVRKMVKHLVRKWKDIVDEWVRLNPEGQHASSGLIASGHSPQQKTQQNGHHQDSSSPNPQNGSSGSENTYAEPGRKPKPLPSKDAPGRATNQQAPVSTSASQNVQRQREQQKGEEFDAERLASARKRLQANYKDIENAKKQRTIQVMDIHELPKSKKAFFPRNKGGGPQGRRW